MSFLLGLSLCVLGMVLPAFLTETRFGIYDMLRNALSGLSESGVLSAAMSLLLLNSLRSTPHYLGLLFIMESIRAGRLRWGLFILKYTLAFFLLLGDYQLIYQLYGIRFVVELPLYVYLFVHERAQPLPHPWLQQGAAVRAVHALHPEPDIMPALTDWGFGHGEIAMDIKMATIVLDCEPLITAFGLLVSMVFAITLLMTVLLILDKQQMRRAMEKEARVELQLMDARIKAIGMRDTFEIQSLVHDLKSPLTAIQGLASLSSAISGDARVQEYQGRISSAADRMSYMISEILYADRRQRIRVNELLEKVRSQFSAQEGAALVRYEDFAGERYVCVNVVRMIRVVINVLSNAVRAVDSKGEIHLWTESRVSYVAICVWDNGRGIAREDLEHIWDIGFSGEGSSGLGLSFVRQTVQKHGGDVRIFSEAGEYTQVELLLRR